jgi:hypothetical protein
MKIEDIAKSVEKLDAWWETFSAMLNSESLVAQGKALLSGFEIAKEFDRAKAEGLHILATFLERPTATSEEEYAASLLRGFEFGAKLADTLHDEFRDIADGETKAIRFTDSIVLALNAIAPGRLRLAVLLDHPNSGVRALAGAYLLDLMPERVLPILRDVEEKEVANSAHFRASVALLGWRCEKVSRFSRLGE